MGWRNSLRHQHSKWDVVKVGMFPNRVIPFHEYPGYNHSHIYLGLHPDIECLSGTVTGDTSSGWQALSRFSLWCSHVSITCLGASESGTAVLDYALLLPSSQ